MTKKSAKKAAKPAVAGRGVYYDLFPPDVKLKNINVEAVAKAIKADAGEKLPGLRKSLEQAKRGEFGAVHTPQMIAERRRGRPVGSRKATSKVAVKLRLDPDVIAALRATGDGWQTRVNHTLRATLRLAGKLAS